MSENENSNRKSKNMNKNEKKSKKKMAIIISVSILAIIIASTIFGYWYVKKQIYVAPTKEKSAESKYKEVEGITNVLLIGTDGRTLDELSRSDTIIIATLDNINKKVKLTSIMRDTLVEIPGYGEQKINAAYAFGGPELLMETISNTFEIHLEEYIAVNFWGFESIIDAIGGIEVDVKDYEIENINEYIGESTGTEADPITEPGLQKLNGAQALSYSRIRSVGNGSYERSERQRTVLFEIAENLVKINPLKYPSLAKDLGSYVKTNIDPLIGLNYAYTIYKFPVLELEQLQIPHSELVEDRLYKDRGWVILMDIEQNAKILHEFIYDNKLPNEDEFDYVARDNVFAAYRADEERYNSLYGINPEEHLEVKDIIPDKDIENGVKVEEIPEAEVVPPIKEETKPPVEENTAPVVSTPGNRTIKVGETFNPMAGVSAIDKEDGTLEVTVSGTVNTSVAGVYTLTYVAVDSKGLKGTATVVITVEAIKPETPEKPAEGTGTVPQTP